MMSRSEVLMRSGTSGVSKLPSWPHRHEIEDEEIGDVPASKKEEVARETSELIELKKRLSVRDLATKFESRRASDAAASPKSAPPESPNVQDKNSLDEGGQFDKLKRILNDLKGRVAARVKDDVEQALDVAEALSAIFVERQKRLASREREEKLASKQREESEVETLPAKLVVQKSHVETQTHPQVRTEAEIQTEPELWIEAVEPPPFAVATPTEQQRIWTDSQAKELETLKREAQEAQRIRMLYESSKARDMENQIESLRLKLVEKSAETAKLRKELDSFKTNGTTEAGMRHMYQLSGHEQLGTTLSIDPVDDKLSDLPLCTIQWYRVSGDGTVKDAIFGAIRPQYAPEPHDVGKFLRAEIQLPNGKLESLQTTGCMEPSPGLEKYVETLISRGTAQFNARIVLKNGEVVTKQSLHTLDVNKNRMKLYNGRSVKANEVYSSSMQVCGARGGGDSAAQGLFWVAKRSLTFMLVLESDRERNAVILLARKFAELNDILLSGPADDLRSK